MFSAIQTASLNNVTQSTFHRPQSVAAGTRQLLHMYTMPQYNSVSAVTPSSDAAFEPAGHNHPLACAGGDRVRCSRHSSGSHPGSHPGIRQGLHSMQRVRH